MLGILHCTPRAQQTAPGEMSTLQYTSVVRRALDISHVFVFNTASGKNKSSERPVPSGLECRDITHQKKTTVGSLQSPGVVPTKKRSPGSFLKRIRFDRGAVSVHRMDQYPLTNDSN